MSSVTAGVGGTHGEHMLGSTGLLLFDLNNLYSQSLRLCGSNCSVEVSVYKCLTLHATISFHLHSNNPQGNLYYAHLSNPRS